MNGPKLATLFVLLPGLALAQVVSVTLPSIRFERAPPLVVVREDVHVIEDYDEDLYVVRGRYYVRRGDHWFRADDHRGHWRRVERRYVPASLHRVPPGQYRRYKHSKHHQVHRVHRNDRHVERARYDDRRRDVRGPKNRHHDRKHDRRGDHHDRRGRR